MSPTKFRSALFILSLAMALCAVRAHAAPPASSCWPLPRWLGVACGCCPDDYCIKPLPPVACPPPQCCPNDYCPKPLPAVPGANCQTSCACYDVKPLPPVPRCCEPWYKCIPFCGGK